MTNERRQDVIVVALVISLVLHIGLMVVAKPRVMTHVVSKEVRMERRGPMKVTNAPECQEPVKIAELKDEVAAKEAPQVEAAGAAVPMAESATPSANGIAMPMPATTTKFESPLPELAVFAANPIKLDGPVVDGRMPVSEFVAPRAAVGAPSASGGVVGAPSTSAIVPKITMPIAIPEAPKAVQERMAVEASKTAFEPTDEVFAEVDEKAVEETKSAVRDMLNWGDAIELKRMVLVSVTGILRGGYRYFKVKVEPRADLKVIEKDVVLLIDASGSIGDDRMSSIRRAAKRILRSVANTGDRFNLVAFRDRYTYAFRRWQQVDERSLTYADSWLNNQAPYGRTDVFGSISSVLTLPRNPNRPLIAFVVTDGEANVGVRGTEEILSKFTALNDGLISVYMYGVKSSANRELIDLLTHGNRGESLIFDGWRWNAGEGMEKLSARFRDPVLSDIRLVPAAGINVQLYPQRLKNLYRGDALVISGRVPQSVKKLSFSMSGLNRTAAYESYFELPLENMIEDPSAAILWQEESNIDAKFR